MRLLPLLSATMLLSLSGLHAESTLTLTNVHNCCKSCEKGITAAVTKVSGATAAIDKTSVVITAADEATTKKAAASLVEGGYFGTGAEAPAIADAKVKSATVSGVHLCCGKCVTAAEKAVKSVSGVSSHNAEKGAKSFTVEGDFSTAALQKALLGAGFSGSIK
jgi:copper chaperone CopZ